ncbi:peroxisomal copper amine oxidase [Microstroma glucosiphilum]|uniref:Amine oxidase n=1 Tax=Pseudomicrostroma glucosiphilum TaxID=1684307 RepID=A0A316UEB8_9BASI|nr:peroxisomal copper amine oxidase [Pseudomicrostroma glucosiphilum]PWN22731.1 peroxisomal copper amine oxidase [Pseudomicrostroma glucosiphilum]
MSPVKVPTAAKHPLDPPAKDEILAVSNAVRTYMTEKLHAKAFRFLNIFLHEPEKNAVIDAGFFAGGSAAAATSKVQRQFWVHINDIVSGAAYEILTTIDNGVSIDNVEKLAEGVQPSLTAEELCLAEEMCRKDQRVLKAAADVGVSAEQLYCDGWSIGWDSRWPGRRLQNCIAYARYGKDEHLYAHPLDFMPVLDCNTGEILAIDYPPHRVGKDGALSSGTTAEPKEASFDPPTERARIPPPTQKHDYLPEFATASPFSPEKPIQMRTDLKPLHIEQPEGVSFKLDGNVLEWQKWKVHVGFHSREGLVLSTITYKDDEIAGASKAEPKERPLFYRMSLAEMVVPYADPAWPHYKKFAFDVGEYGLGFLANSLSLGCDCLGQIQYMDGHNTKHDGSVDTVKNAICIHEEDTGLMWKHTDYRSGGRAHNVRGRKLVISMVCTVANYEYQINWSFHLDGNIELDIKLTGILNLYLLAPGEPTGGYATEVAPQISAHLHQHLFSLRVDPHIDGPRNSVVEQEIVAKSEPTGSNENWAGNGFTTVKRVLQTAGEAVRDANPNNERSWTIVNENVKHYSSGSPVGYKLMTASMPKLYAKQDSICAVRAPFSKHSLWTVPYEEMRLYPAGRYPVQTREVQKDSVQNWVGDGSAKVANEDIITFFTVGTTHVPRPEDFPVMPAETIRVMFKPVGFFARNPALDVPSVQDAKSVAAKFGMETGATNGTNGTSCCK